STLFCTAALIFAASLSTAAARALPESHSANPIATEILFIPPLLSCAFLVGRPPRAAAGPWPASGSTKGCLLRNAGRPRPPRDRRSRLPLTAPEAGQGAGPGPVGPPHHPPSAFCGARLQQQLNHRGIPFLFRQAQGRFTFLASRIHVGPL